MDLFDLMNMKDSMQYLLSHLDLQTVSLKGIGIPMPCTCLDVEVCNLIFLADPKCQRWRVFVDLQVGCDPIFFCYFLTKLGDQSDVALRGCLVEKYERLPIAKMASLENDREA